MHVRKFHADSLEEALKEIKRELGPDAIILKTVTNKGIKGAFKKNKIEITAAISEKNYVKKARVDHVLTGEQRNEFYSGRASYVSNMIDSHAGQTSSSKSGYGKLALNRSVSTTQQKEDNFLDNPSPMPTLSMNLTDFLSGGKDEDVKPQKKVELREEHFKTSEPNPVPVINDKRIDQLEKKIFELTKRLQEVSNNEPTGLYQLRTTLRSLDISEIYVQQIIRKAVYELDQTQQDDQDTVFEFALSSMMKAIKTDRPLFSSVENQGVITVLLSDMSCGQTSMMMKLGAVKSGTTLIKYSKTPRSRQITFTEKIFGLNVVQANSISEVVSECRKKMDENQHVIVDFRAGDDGQGDETRKFIEGLKRSFDKVEVLISLSAIHSELYNRKVLAKYRTLADGMVVSHLDLCLNFGALFNVANEEGALPFKFFGTGEVVPDDLEAASSERLLAGIFQL